MCFQLWEILLCPHNLIPGWVGAPEIGPPHLLWDLRCWTSPEADGGRDLSVSPLAQHPWKASALGEPPNLPGLCHIGHMDGVDATGVGSRALDLCTVLEPLLSCPHGACNETKQTQLAVS